MATARITRSSPARALARTFASYSSSSSSIAVSPAVVDRGSTFVGRAASISTTQDVQEVLDEILTDKKVAKSSHPTMYAYQLPTAQGKHDCGECGAGTVLTSLLEHTKATNVLVVVTRWYGGSPLGPARFRHIASAGRQALAQGGFLPAPPAGGGDGRSGKEHKRRKK